MARPGDSRQYAGLKTKLEKFAVGVAAKTSSCCQDVDMARFLKAVLDSKKMTVNRREMRSGKTFKLPVITMDPVV